MAASGRARPGTVRCGEAWARGGPAVCFLAARGFDPRGGLDYGQVMVQLGMVGPGAVGLGRVWCGLPWPGRVSFMRSIAITTIIALACGCLATKLRVPTEDHYVQMRVIEERCREQGCNAELQEDLAAMSRQACLLAAIAVGDDGKACGGGE